MTAPAGEPGEGGEGGPPIATPPSDSARTDFDQWMTFDPFDGPNRIS